MGMKSLLMNAQLADSDSAGDSPLQLKQVEYPCRSAQDLKRQHQKRRRSRSKMAAHTKLISPVIPSDLVG